MVLHLDCTVREGSRTRQLAQAYLKDKQQVTHLDLIDLDIKPLTREMLDKRTYLLEHGMLQDPMFDMARQFASADEIVISAPFWDGSFPSVLKVYIENIYVIGIVSDYTPEGAPYGLCKADKLTYITTAGGKYIPDFSYDYIRAVFENNFGIKESRLIKAEMLDIEGFDCEAILSETISRMQN